MFFSESDLSLELIGIFKIERNSGTLESHKDRIYDSISIRLDGCGHFKTDSKEYITKRGDLIYIPRTMNYSHSTPAETIIAIHFINYSFYAKNKIEVLSPENYTLLEEIIIHMYNEWNEKKQGYKYKCTSLLYSLLYQLNYQIHDDIVTAVSHDKKIRTAIDYIHSNFRKRSISVSQLADICAVSETYFRKIFKKIYSVSPNQYIINLRLEYASQLLQSHLYTISEVSERSGFHDVKYFSRLFRKRSGYSPREYQNIQPDKLLK